MAPGLAAASPVRAVGTPPQGGGPSPGQVCCQQLSELLLLIRLKLLARAQHQPAPISPPKMLPARVSRRLPEVVHKGVNLACRARAGRSPGHFPGLCVFPHGMPAQAQPQGGDPGRVAAAPPGGENRRPGPGFRLCGRHPCRGAAGAAGSGSLSPRPQRPGRSARGRGCQTLAYTGCGTGTGRTRNRDRTVCLTGTGAGVPLERAAPAWLVVAHRRRRILRGHTGTTY